MSDRWENQYKIWSDYVSLPTKRSSDKLCLGIQPLSSSSLITFASSCAQRLAGLHSYHSTQDLSGNLDTYTRKSRYVSAYFIHMPQLLHPRWQQQAR